MFANFHHATQANRPLLMVMMDVVLKKRQFQYVVQGRFKKRLGFSSVYTGQAFSGPLTELPSSWILSPFLYLLAQLQPGMEADLTSESPYILSPLMSTCQNIVVSKVGEEPAIRVDAVGVQPIVEDLRILGADFQPEHGGEAATSGQRARFFSDRVNLSKFSFDPELGQIEFGMFSYDILGYLGYRPIQVMATVWDPASRPSHKSGEWPYLYYFEIWHERSLAML
eukprot:gene163-164_t